MDYAQGKEQVINWIKRHIPLPFWIIMSIFITMLILLLVLIVMSIRKCIFYNREKKHSINRASINNSSIANGNDNGNIRGSQSASPHSFGSEEKV